jgi:hypothetical protein
MNDNTKTTQPDSDQLETQEWLESLQAVLEREGPERAHFLIEQLVDYTRRSGGYLPYKATTAYINTIPAQLGKKHPGNIDLEYRIRSIIRWNAMATVRVSLPRRAFTTWASTTFSGDLSIPGAATWSSSRAIPPRVFMPAHTWKGGLPKNNSTASARNPTARD